MKNKKPSIEELSEFEDITVVPLEDPLWDAAYEELSKRGDPKAIARLLKDQVPMPAYVGRSLGIMLDPPNGYKGVRLRSSGKAGIAERQNAVKKLVERKRQAEQLRALQDGRKVESAASAAEEKMGMSRSTFFDKKKFDALEAVFESQKILGYVDHQERKTKKKQTKNRSSSPRVRKKES